MYLTEGTVSCMDGLWTLSPLLVIPIKIPFINFHKKNNVREFTISSLKLQYRVAMINKKNAISTEDPNTNKLNFSHLIFENNAEKNTRCDKKASSINGTTKTGCLTAEERKRTCVFLLASA